MKNINWNDVQEATERRDLPIGGYVAGICKATDEPAKERLNIEWEVAEGEFKGYWREQTASLVERGKLNPGEWAWGGKTIKSYKEKALPFFKGFITAVEQSNPGYKFNNDEKTLRGKLVGVVLREEEYMGNDGNIKTKLVVDRFTSVDKIRSGDYEVRPKKTLAGASGSGYSQGGNDDFSVIEEDGSLPFWPVIRDHLPYIRAALSGWTGVWKDDYLLPQLHIAPPSLPRHLREVQGREERLRGTQGFRV